MELVKSAILVLCRDAPTLEVLLTQRSENISLAHHWVFPGGRRDPQPDGSLEDGRLAALREGEEEIGVNVTDAIYLDTIQHEQTAKNRMNKVNVYAAPMPKDQNIVPNPLEVQAFRWYTPLAAITAHHKQQIIIPPLTLETLYNITQYSYSKELFQYSALRNFITTPCRSLRNKMKLSQK